MNAVNAETAEKVTELHAPAPGPGERLRAARLTQGLDRAKVAAQLHLRDDMVADMERDDYARLPARVFVRGYLRNYARLVGIPAESILRQFDERCPDQDACADLNRVNAQMRREVRSSHGVVRFFTWLIIIAMAVLFVTWWRGYLQWPETTPAAPEEPAPEALEPVVPVQPDGTLRLPELGAVPEAAPTSAPVSAEGSASGPAAAALPEPPPAAPDEEVAVPPAPVETPPERSAAPTPAAAEPATLVAQAAGGGSTSQPAPVAPRVVLEFSDDCWVGIRDAERRFKLFGTIPKGSRKVLGGVPPYRLVLGNASAVRVSVDGRPFDIGPYVRDNVARFTLDPRTPDGT